MGESTETDYTLTNAEDDALMAALHRVVVNDETFDDDDFRAVVAGLIAPHVARAQAHYAAFVGAEAELARLRAECQRGQSCTAEDGDPTLIGPDGFTRLVSPPGRESGQ